MTSVIRRTVLPHLQRTKVLPYAVVAVIGVGLSIVFIYLGFPAPQVDDAVYKSPAAELVQHGRFAIPCGVGYFHRADEVFACYPPVYPLTISGWYWLSGVSLRSSLAFTFTVHLLLALFMMAVAKRLIGDAIPVLWRNVILVCIGLCHFANLAFFDRQEELALLFVFGAVLWATNRPFVSGVLVGIAGLTSPWVGVLGVLLISLYEFIQFRPLHALFRRVGVFVAAAGCVVAGWMLMMEVSHPGVINDQFLGHMRHLKESQQHGSIMEQLQLLLSTVMFNSSQLPLLIVTLALFAIAVASDRKKCSPLAIAMFAASVIGLLVVVAIRPKAYTYLGAAHMLLLPCLAPALLRYFESTSRVFGKLILIGCTLFAFKDAATTLLTATRLPVQERPDQVFEQLHALIPPGEKTAVTARHWHAFQGRNPWREAFFVSIGDPDEILTCQWLVLRPGIGLPPMIEQFEQVHEVDTSVNYNRTYAYSVWRRKG